MIRKKRGDVRSSAAAAEVVGSNNPTRSIFIILDNYGIKSGLF
jgi:hypothetical protein